MNSSIVCGYTEESPFSRLLYISAGGVLASIGCASNVLLFLVFIKPQLGPSPSTLYAAVLSLFDFLLCLIYILLFVVDANMIYWKDEALFQFYHDYILVVFVGSKVVQFCIPHLLMLATFEKYAWVTNKYKSAASAAIGVSLLLRTPVYAALSVEEYTECSEPMRTLAVAPAKWTLRNNYYEVYDVYIIVFLQTIQPFVLLCALNVLIVRKIHRSHKRVEEFICESSNIAQPCRRKIGVAHMLMSAERTLLPNKLVEYTQRLSQLPPNVRNAVYTTVAIVSTYLLSNSLHIVLLLLERMDADILKDAADPYIASPFYTAFGDFVSMSYMTSSAVRILIYALCSPETRALILASLRLRPATLRPDAKTTVMV